MAAGISVERLRSLTEAASSVVGVAQLESLLGRLVETACVATDATYGALGVIGDHKTLIEFVHRGMDEKTIAMVGHLPTGRGVLGTLIREGAVIRIEKISEHPDSVGFPEHHPAMDTFLGVPVAVGREAYGNLYLTEKSGGFTAEDELVVSALAAIAGAAVETTRLRARLEHLAVLADRERIGRDLHDSIIQDLFATGLELQGLASFVDDSMVGDGLNRAVDRIDSTIETLRHVIADLHRGPSESTLEEQIRAHVLQLAEPYDTDVAVSVSPRELILEVGLIDRLVPIVGEAVSNALRHSGSDLIEVAVETIGDSLVLAVTDHGRGFEPDSVQRGMGLGNLETRSRSLGGDLSIRSVAGTGTVVEVVFPIS